MYMFEHVCSLSVIRSKKSCIFCGFVCSHKYVGVFVRVHFVCPFHDLTLKWSDIQHPVFVSSPAGG